MSHLASTTKSLGWFLFLGLLITPALAHNVEVSGDVAATFHLEPNHNPKAGEPAQVWFALTRKGGQIIPLQQCNCKLAVYSQPRSQDTSPLLEPPVKAISADGYQNIPGAEIVFPKVGAYELELNGTPKAGVNFKPFQLNYEVTVAAGAPTPVAQLPSPSSQPSQLSQPSGQWQTTVIALSTFLGLGILYVVLRQLKGKRR
jgi:hypothetical protein